MCVCEKCTTLNEWERVATVSKNCENDLCTWHIFVSYLHMLRHMLVLIRSCFHHQLNAVWQHTWIIVCVRAVVRCRNLCRIPGKQPIVPDNLVYIHLCITIGYGRLFFFLPCSPLPCDAFYILLFLSHSPLYRDFWRKKKTRSEFVQKANKCTLRCLCRWELNEFIRKIVFLDVLIYSRVWTWYQHRNSHEHEILCDVLQFVGHIGGRFWGSIIFFSWNQCLRRFNADQDSQDHSHCFRNYCLPYDPLLYVEQKKMESISRTIIFATCEYHF